jgi:hypothetical protein
VVIKTKIKQSVLKVSKRFNCGIVNNLVAGFLSKPLNEI